MNPYDDQPNVEIDRLLAEIEQPVQPATAFRAALEQELATRLAPRRGDQPLPPGWAICPFDRFCVAEQRLPVLARRHCPCLHAGPLLRLLVGRTATVHARPCAALAQREAENGDSS